MHMYSACCDQTLYFQSTGYRRKGAGRPCLSGMRRSSELTAPIMGSDGMLLQLNRRCHSLLLNHLVPPHPPDGARHAWPAGARKLGMLTDVGCVVCLYMANATAMPRRSLIAKLAPPFHVCVCLP